MTTNDPGSYSNVPAGGQHPPPWANQPAYPPPPAAPAPKRSWVRRHKILTGLGVLVALITIGGIAGGGSDGSGKDDPAALADTTPASGSGVGAPATKAAPKKTTEAAESKSPGIGQSVRDGKFEFTVTKLTCGVPAVGGEYGAKADGQFCLVSMKVENIGDKAQLLDASSQYGYDAADRKLSADSAAGIYANQDGGGAFLNEINPGNSASAVIVFDIPKTAKLMRLELHDSPFSGGVKVALG